jgi:hypothetical protein
MKWLILGAVIIFALAIWHFLPVGNLSGRRIVPKDLSGLMEKRGTSLDPAVGESSLAIRHEFRHAAKIRKASEIRKLLNEPDKPAVFDF